MAAYYNEIDGFAAQWLRNLIAAGLIAPGDVDTRSIVDVKPDDLIGYTQCHFFAGIGGWSLAARLAGWDDSRELWTGSCPCQSFSCAGRGKGVADERHLWPDFYRLIRGSRPSVVMGEQVAGKAGYAWLDGVLSDMEAEAYTGRAVDIPACSVNTPHIRNRLYWLADTRREFISIDRKPGSVASASRVAEDNEEERQRMRVAASDGGSPPVERMGYATLPTGARQRQLPQYLSGSPDGGLGDSKKLHGNVSGDHAGSGRESSGPLSESGDSGSTRELANAVYDGRRTRAASQSRCQSGAALTRSGGRDGFWDDWTVVGPDPEGKYRRVKPGIRLLANGVPSRVGKLRGGGNAIVPELAAEVIRAYMDIQ